MGQRSQRGATYSRTVALLRELLGVGLESGGLLGEGAALVVELGGGGVALALQRLGAVLRRES